jgi:hypothetical protein
MSRGELRVIIRGCHDYRTGPRLQTVGMSPGSDPLTDGAQPSPVWQQVQTLGVAEIAVTILNARKTMPGATAAAVSREKHGGGFRVRVSLRGDAPSPDDGNPQDQRSGEEEIAIFVARHLGKDLTDAFGGRDVIILT